MKERKQYTKEFRMAPPGSSPNRDARWPMLRRVWVSRRGRASRWVRVAKTKGGEAFRGHGQRPPLEQENFELRQKSSNSKRSVLS
jgi:hypothetical protein